MCDCATRSVRFLIRGRVDEFNINRWRIMAIGPTLGIAPIGRGRSIAAIGFPTSEEEFRARGVGSRRARASLLVAYDGGGMLAFM